MAITMKKILLFLSIFIFSINISAQLDREHWFPPMFDGQMNFSGYEQFLHLSTNDTTPFKVYIYSNNVLVDEVTISKGSPGVVNIFRDYIITLDETDNNKVGKRGLYVKGDRPFFANLRFGVTNHTEIITSKGTAGIGKAFYTVMAPNEQINSYFGASASFLATEDNTTVTISDFKKPIYFSELGDPPSITFTFNKGESFIADARAITLENKDGFIGAKVISDKPISMINGNFNGQYASSSAEGSDILMDQSVPVDKLGHEFVVVKGYGLIGNNMEGAMIVATEKNTSIYLNDATTPIATLANEGDYYRVSENHYENRGNNHYNLHITTDKNVYVYQLLAGVEAGTAPLATGGMNYIPPLNCYLPRKIDEISYINKIKKSDSDDRFVTKLNIITEKGAIIKVNGVVPAIVNGPYNVSNITANQQWVTYSIPNVKGNITVESDKAVTAGIASGNGAFGYGGYFAGFSSIPLILKVEGECLPGVKLAVTEGFDSYKWLVKNNSGGYNPAPGVNNTFNYIPPQAGIYAVKIQQGSCPEIQTQDFKFYNCTTYTNANYETCTVVTDIKPQFSLSTQTIDLATLKIDTPPTKGTAVIGTDGKITYTANPGSSGIDTFKYSYCGLDPIPDCETAQATIQINQVVSKDVVLTGCTPNGIATYDLRKANVTTDTAASKIYYKSRNGADNEIINDVIGNFTAYTTTDTTVFVRIKNAKNCFAVQAINLKSAAFPIVQESLYTTVHCDEEDGIIDGNYIVNPTVITPIVLANSTGFTVKYYDTLQKATIGGTDNIKANYSFTPSTSKIFINVLSSEGCVTVKEITLKIGTKTPLITKILDVDVCDLSYNNAEAINLADQITKLTSSAAPVIKYYKTMEDATKGQNAIAASQTILPGKSTFYYVIKDGTFCSDIATVNFTLIKGFASTSLPANITICEGTTTELDAGKAHKFYNWYKQSDPATVIGTSEKITLGPGKYFVILTSPNTCEYKQNVEILASPKAILDITKLKSTICDDDFDGKINIKFSTEVTPTIVRNNSSLYTVTYYSAATMSTAQLLPDTWSYSADTPVYVKITSPYCVDIFGTINFKIGKKVTLLGDVQTDEVCDDDFDGTKLVQNLNDFKTLFTTDLAVSAKFYLKKSDAQTNASNSITEINVVKQQLLYVRLSNATDCDALGELTIKIKIPKKSEDLKDKTICPEDTTDLDAGAGFDKYEWYSESDPTKIIGTNHNIDNLPVGKYFVILKGFYPNDCPFPQNVEIKAAELPTIETIEITGSTVKINAKGGKQPYKYAIDGGNYQDSNVFLNVPAGIHKAYVISADDCDPVEKEFSVIEIYNVITPNSDGINDVLDMSLLKIKVNPKFTIFDRAGRKLFEGDTKNNFIWDGKENGKVLSTSSYWYIMEWQDFDYSPAVKYTGWILLKNRNTD